MKNMKNSRFIQLIVYFLFTVTLFFMGVSVYARLSTPPKSTLPAKMVISSGITSSDIGISVSLIGLIIAFILMVVATIWKRIPNIVHGILMVFLSEILMFYFTIVTGEYNFLYIGNYMLIFIISVYQDTRLHLISIIAYLIICIISTIMKGVDNKYGASGALVNLFIFIGIIASLVYTTSIVTKLKRQEKIIRENRRSSQDMLRVVEMKRLEANEAARAKSMFLSNMSHEIRTPINSILGMDEIILKESNELNIIEYAGNIQNAGETLLSIVNDILDLSKITSGKMNINNSDYKIADVLNDLYNLVYIKAEEKGLKITFDISSELPSELYGDSLRLKQVLLNILNNAVKYTDKGFVKLKIDVMSGDDGDVNMLFLVEDSGIGIKEKYKKRIFNSFERVDESAGRTVEGTGLGMSITKSLVSLMNGKLYLESEYGKGSTFYVELSQKIKNLKPIGSFSPKSVYDIEAYREQFKASDIRILVVDDNEMNLAVVKGLLKRTEMRIDTATSGIKAIDMAKHAKYDIVMLDHMMPGMDGIETFNKIKQLKDSPSGDAVYIALTANAIAGARETYIQAGFDDYISKPVKGSTLEKVLMKYIPEDKISVSYSKEAAVIPVEEESEGGHVKLSAGLKFVNNNKELYDDFVRAFISSSSEKQTLIRNYADSRDWKKYTIEVHALKSNAAYIGAEHLYELAAAHEKAAKEYNEQYIAENTNALFMEWDSVITEISEINKEPAGFQSNGQTMSEEDVYRCIEDIKVCLTKFESDEAERLINKLAEYEISDELHKRIVKASDYISNFNYSKAVDILSE